MAPADRPFDVPIAAAELRRRFPRTAEAFAALSEGDAALGHIVQLERSFADKGALQPLDRRDDGTPDTFDVVLAGGGLSLIYAAALARAGVRVCVFDRRAIGCGHREWNISRAELSPLSASGLFTADEVAALLRMQYRVGICRFGDGADHPVRDVLDCVIDADTLLHALRDKAVAAGATLIPYHTLAGYRVDRDGVTVAIDPVILPGTAASAQAGARSQGRRYLRARLLIDALGAHSPHARFDLICPTVGGVMDDLIPGPGRDQIDPSVGEILITTEGVEEGEQHIWEGFPAPPDPASGLDVSASRRMTIYLFYYQRASRIAARLRAGQHPLLALYERYFATLPRYKSGDLRLLRPTYGFIPAYTRLGPMPAAPQGRVLLVGDAAARHSPLTFCGFGSMIRSFWPLSQGVLAALRSDRLSAADLTALWREPPALQVMGGLTLMMMPPDGRDQGDRDGINRLLDAAFGVLAGMGQDRYAAFLQDNVDADTFMRFMWATAKLQPSVYQRAFVHLTPAEVARWLTRLWQFRRLAPTASHSTTPPSSPPLMP